MYNSYYNNYEAVAEQVAGSLVKAAAAAQEAEQVVAAAEQLAPGVVDQVTGLFKMAGPMSDIGTALGMAGDSIGGAAKNIGSALGLAGEAGMNGLKDVGAAIGLAGGSAADGIKDLVGKGSDAVKGGYDKAVAGVKDLVGKGKGAAGKAVDSTANALDAAKKWLTHSPDSLRLPGYATAAGIDDAAGVVGKLARGATGLTGNALGGLLGGGIGAATNDGNRAAGAIGGGIGGTLGSLLGRIPMGNSRAGMLGQVLAGLAGAGAGGYGGGKLGAMLDQQNGNVVTNKTNEIIDMLRGKLGM